MKLIMIPNLAPLFIIIICHRYYSTYRLRFISYLPAHVALTSKCLLNPPSFCLFSISSLSTDDGSENCRMIKGKNHSPTTVKPPLCTCRHYKSTQLPATLPFDSTTTHDLFMLNRALRPNCLHMYVNLLFPRPTAAHHPIIRLFRHSHSSQCTSADLNFRCTTALLHLVCWLSFFSRLIEESRFKSFLLCMSSIAKYPVLLLRS